MIFLYDLLLKIVHCPTLTHRPICPVHYSHLQCMKQCFEFHLRGQGQPKYKYMLITVNSLTQIVSEVNIIKQLYQLLRSLLPCFDFKS